MKSHSNVEYLHNPMWYSLHDFFGFYGVPMYVESFDFYHTDSFILFLKNYVLY